MLPIVLVSAVQSLGVACRGWHLVVSIFVAIFFVEGEMDTCGSLDSKRVANLHQGCTGSEIFTLGRSLSVCHLANAYCLHQ